MPDTDTRAPGEPITTPNRAVMLTAMGDDGRIEVRDADLPRPVDDGIVLRVAAASVNPVDWKIRDGAAPFVEAGDLPLPCGRDCAGTVALLGTAAHSMIRVGDRVLAHIGGFERGGQARFVALKAGEFTAVPDGVDITEAGAMPLVGMTAYQGLFDHGQLEAGQSVLIHGAAGGVGHVAVQLAKIRGATVHATCSGKDADFVRGLGADTVIDYHEQRFEDVVSDVDLVLDLIGGDTQQRSFAVLRDGGTLVTTLQEEGEPDGPGRGIRTAAYMAQPNPAQLGEIVGYMADGRLKVTVARTFPLDQAQDAWKADEDGHDRGKIVITM